MSLILILVEKSDGLRCGRRLNKVLNEWYILFSPFTVNAFACKYIPCTTTHHTKRNISKDIYAYMCVCVVCVCIYVFNISVSISVVVYICYSHNGRADVAVVSDELERLCQRFVR